MRISQEAMDAALKQLKVLMYSTKWVSLYESFLTAKFLTALGKFPGPTIQDVNDAVDTLFVFDAAIENGRLGPFRWDWRTVDQSGRKTVWNNTTRGKKEATAVFLGDDFRNGLLPNAADIVHDALAPKGLPSVQALCCLILRDHSFASTDTWVEAENELKKRLGLSDDELTAICTRSALGPPLLSSPPWSMSALPPMLAPPSPMTVAPPVAPGTPPPPTSGVVIDARTERMLRRAVSSYPCVLLVGPPGTGKGTLVRWISAEVTAAPSAFGFNPSLVPDPMWRTPDESWSAFDIVGGLAPDDTGTLRWADGLLLQALSDNRWLVLDETNRADMDKVMGPLLTWLSEQDVELGRTEAHGGVPVSLGWGSSWDCVADDPHGAGRLTRYLAGSDWRLIGTYNPQDAQRVFRFGQALSRRFVTVPVPALMPGLFDGLLANRYPSLDIDAADMISRLYAAHYSAPETVLGPAVFLRLAEYVQPVDATDLASVISEAYVMSLGKYLASYDDDTFDSLGRRIVDDEQALPAADWSWISESRDTLG